MPRGILSCMMLFGCERPAVCGDGRVDFPEYCDPGSAVACNPDCTPARCGDGRVALWEACDDGNDADGDACPHDCAICGDGQTQGEESCDDANEQPCDMCNMCRLIGEPRLLIEQDGTGIHASAQRIYVRNHGGGSGSRTIAVFSETGSVISRFQAAFPGGILGGDLGALVESSTGEILYAGSAGVRPEASYGYYHAHVFQFSVDGVARWVTELPVNDASDNTYVYDMAAGNGVVALTGFRSDVFAGGGTNSYGAIWVLRESDGTLLWSDEMTDRSTGGLAIAMDAGGRVCMSAENGWVRCYSPAGGLLWAFDTFPGLDDLRFQSDGSLLGANPTQLVVIDAGTGSTISTIPVEFDTTDVQWGYTTADLTADSVLVRVTREMGGRASHGFEVYGLDGLRRWAAPPGELTSFGYHAAVGPNGWLWAPEGNANEIVIFDPPCP